MIQIIVDNSYSKVTGLSVKQEKELKEVLSYTTGSFFSRFGPTKKSMLNKRGEFPTGLLGRVESYLAKGGYAKKDLRLKPSISLKALSFPDAYAWQQEALHIATLEGNGIIEAPTGTGKSRAMRMIAETFNTSTLIIVPSIEIRNQLRETFKGLNNVTIENIDSNKLESLTNFNMLILDECHRAASATYRRLNKTAWKGIYYRFHFSATPFRNQEEETLLFEGIAGRCIYRLPYQKAVAAKYIVPIEAYYLEVPKQQTNAHSWAQVYSQLVVNNETRSLMISKLLLTIEEPTLCLVREVAHGKILSKMSGVPFVSGADDESRDYIRQFNAGEIKTLIGTQQILGEGIDSRPAQYIILAGLGKAKSQLMQAFGRGVRNYPGKDSAKIILLSDKSHKFTLTHFRTECKVLKDEYGVKPLKLENI